jgi:hypothetical protein
MTATTAQEGIFANPAMSRWVYVHKPFEKLGHWKWRINPWLLLSCAVEIMQLRLEITTQWPKLRSRIESVSDSEMRPLRDLRGTPVLDQMVMELSSSIQGLSTQWQGFIAVGCGFRDLHHKLLQDIGISNAGRSRILQLNRRTCFLVSRMRKRHIKVTLCSIWYWPER